MCNKLITPAPMDIPLNINIDHVGEISGVKRISYPSSKIYGVIRTHDDNTLSTFRWGFTLPGGGNAYNTRIETANKKGLWINAWYGHRALIPVTSFFEGRGEDEVEIKLGFGAIAGVYRLVVQGDTIERQVSILTMPSVPSVAKYHDRMPVVVSPENYDRWLYNDDSSPRKVLSLTQDLSSLGNAA